jgi:septal ring factor EnvC (AmiA/AmiB activator)
VGCVWALQTYRTSERDALASQLEAAQVAVEGDPPQPSQEREKLMRKMAQELRDVKTQAAEREKKLKHQLQRVKAEREEALLQVERAQRDKLKKSTLDHPLQATREY